MTTDNLNFVVNPAKTQSIYFAKGSRKELQISINNEPIQQSSSIKILGRDISSSLSISKHFRRIKEEAQNSTSALNMLTTIKGGLDPKYSLTIYRSLIRSKVEYARSSSCGAPKTIEKFIETFQNSQLRRCLGLPKDTPNQILYHMSCELPPRLRAFWLTSKEIVTLSNYNNAYVTQSIKNNPVNSPYYICYEKFADIFNRILPPQPIITTYKLNVETTLQGFHGKSKNEVDHESIKKPYSDLIIKLKAEGFGVFAIDASISTELNKCGLSVIDDHNNISYNYVIHEQLSSQFAELSAIDQAVDIILDHNLTKVAVLTDSKTAFQPILKKSDDNFIVASIINKIERSSTLTDFHLIWTPGHIGIDLNEEADAEARNALDNGQEILPSLTPNEALNKIKNKINDEWEEQYVQISAEKGKYYFEIFPNLLNKCWFKKNSSLNPAETKLINRLLTNHCYNKPYFHRIRIIDSPNCDFCHVIESNQHFFFECAKYDRFRINYSIFSTFSTIQDVLKSLNEKFFKQLSSFAKVTNFEVNITTN